MEIRLKVLSANNNSQLVPALWVYYPKLHPEQNHSITRNINKVKGEFVNYIDTEQVKKVIICLQSRQQALDCKS